MIEYLRIRNLALIADMELEFSRGLNVLTGETGAGKSFIMKAINFIMGERLGSDMVRPGKERAQVEALFSLPDGDLVVRRELLAESGRSRFFINDALSSQETVKEWRHKLILHASQHGQQRIAQPASQAELVDRWMNRPDLLARRDELVGSIQRIRAEKETLLRRSQELSDKRELLELHLRDIRKVNPQPGEEDELERKRAVMREAAQKQEQYNRAFMALQSEEGPGLAEQLGLFERELEQLCRYEPDMAQALEVIENARDVISDLSLRLRRPPSEETDCDPNEIEARLYALAQLKRKLRRTMPEILAMRGELEESLSFLDACALDISRAEREEQKAIHNYAALLEELNAAREKAAENFCLALERELAGLGFSKEVRVIPRAESDEVFPCCIEHKIRLFWAPNPGQNPQPLDRIASGGELSRFLLAAISLQAANDPVTLIFDEVDAGVGGVTLNRVAERLEELAARRQILLITHWPQLAARALSHFQVTKTIEENETFTRCKKLDAAGRKAELDRMAGIET